MSLAVRNQAVASVAVPATILLLVISISLPSVSLAQDWPQFRGVGGNATAPDATTPTTWSDNENIAWKTKLTGRGSSSPIVVGDRIFLTAYSGYGMSGEAIANKGGRQRDNRNRNNQNRNELNRTGGQDKQAESQAKQSGEPAVAKEKGAALQGPGDKADLKLHMLCFHRSTGKLDWDVSIAASEDEQEFTARVADHGYVSGTPASDGEAVYAFFGVSGACAFDFDGNVLWHNDKLGSNTAGFGSASSPVVFENMVFINASIEGGTLYALDKKTGDIMWKKTGIEKCWSSPCVAKTEAGETELVINQKETVYGLNPQTGEELWSCTGIPDYVVPVPVSKDGIIYCLGGRSNRAMAIRLGGRGDVTKTHKLWEVNVGANVTSPVLVDGHLYWASDKGIANCLNAADGKSVFRERMPTGSRVYASIVHAGGKLYLTTRDSGIQVLEAKPKHTQLAVNKIESDTGLFNASPAISNNQILLRTDSYLYCIGE